MCDEGDNDITGALPATGKKREEMKEVALLTYQHHCCCSLQFHYVENEYVDSVGGNDDGRFFPFPPFMSPEKRF